ncbi:hypothetical protein B484DRAFT_388965, partial [Ochromonadaceae sp. CCMP2298]
MLDSSSFHKQEVAVKTLGQVVSSTGLVVTPYLQYPQLLPSALELLVSARSSRPPSLHLEVLRTLGLLGALQPNKYAMIVSFLQRRDRDRKTEQVQEHRSRNSDDTGGAGGAGGGTGTAGGAALAAASHGAVTAAQTLMSGAAGLQEQDLVRTDVLAADNADEVAYLGMYEQSVPRSLSSDAPGLEPEGRRATPNDEDYYPRVAVAALIK